MIRIPVSVYVIKYTVAKARKFNEFDFLVLKAIRAGISDISELEILFSIPKRMLMEVVIGLIEFGFVGLKSILDGGFIVTKHGGKITTMEEMSATIELERKSMILVRENILGTLMKRDPDFPYDYSRNPDERQSVQPVKSPPPSSLPLSQARAVIRGELGKPTEYLHYIESAALLFPSNFTSIREENGMLRLPKVWEEAGVQDALAKRPALKKSPEKVGQDKDEKKEKTLRGFKIQEDILWSGRDHEDALKKGIESALSHLLVISAHARQEVVRHLQPLFLEAIERGVHIDLVVGIGNRESGFGLEEMQKVVTEMRNKANYHAFTGTIELHESADPSDAKLLLFDTASNKYQATFGSYNWLYETIGAAHAKDREVGRDISIKVEDPKVIAEIVENMAGWHSGLSSRWQAIAREEIQSASENELPNTDSTEESVPYRLLYDQANGHAFEDLQYRSEERLLVCSYKLGKATIGQNEASDMGRIRYLGNKPHNFKTYLFYKEITGRNSWTTGDEEILKRRLSGSNPIIMQTPVHSRVVVGDDTVLLSSFNFLSASLKANKHIGIKLDSKKLADLFWENIVDTRSSDG